MKNKPKKQKSKKKKSVGQKAQITKRDIPIFKVVGLGMATLSMILRLLADVHGVDITRDALKRRLWLLRCGGYIMTKKYPRAIRHGHMLLYSLTSKAVSILTTLGYPVEKIRQGLPSDTMVLHELAVTVTMHTILAEAAREHYTCNYQDSSLLRQLREKKSRDPIPDLYLVIDTKDGRTIEVRIEVDRSTRPAHVMAQQLNKQAVKEEIIIVLCTSDRRIESLQRSCQKAYTHYTGFVYFAHLETFRKDGFLHTPLLTVSGEKRWLAIYKQDD